MLILSLEQSESLEKTHFFADVFRYMNRDVMRHETMRLTFEPPHDKTNKMICAPSKDSDQPGHLPSLIRVFAVHSVGG